MAHTLCDPRSSGWSVQVYSTFFFVSKFEDKSLLSWRQVELLHDVKINSSYVYFGSFTVILTWFEIFCACHVENYG